MHAGWPPALGDRRSEAGRAVISQLVGWVDRSDSCRLFLNHVCMCERIVLAPCQIMAVKGGSYHFSMLLGVQGRERLCTSFHSARDSRTLCALKFSHEAHKILSLKPNHDCAFLNYAKTTQEVRRQVSIASAVISVRCVKSVGKRLQSQGAIRHHWENNALQSRHSRSIGY